MSRKNGGIIGPANTPVGGLMSGVAGGVWRMNDVLDFVSNSQWPLAAQNIENSCRFNSGDSARLTRTQTSGDRNKATFSAWLKRSKLGANQGFFGIYGASSDAGQIEIRFQSSGEGFHISGQATNWRRTNRNFTDVSAWYHLVVAFDTTLSTADDRVKVYVNGVQETSFAASGNPSQNSDLPFGLNGATCSIGSDFNAGSAGNFFGGYLAEVVLIDGQQLDPTSFGETDSTTGIWKPRKIGQQFAAGGGAGTNGFYLDFKDSSNLGNDASGLNNDFTVNNLTSIDQSTDTCVENFATLNPLDVRDDDGRTLSEGNLNFTTSSGNGSDITSTIAVSGSGKWYFEIKISAQSGSASSSARFGIVGIRDLDKSTPFSAGNAYYIYSDGRKEDGANTTNSAHPGYSLNDIVQVALDLDNGNIFFGLNGSWGDNSGNFNQTFDNATAFFTSINTDGFWSAYLNKNVTADNALTLSANFGSPAFSISSGNSDANGHGNFEYAVPSGYYALNTSNLNTYG